MFSELGPLAVNPCATSGRLFPLPCLRRVLRLVIFILPIFFIDSVACEPVDGMWYDLVTEYEAHLNVCFHRVLELLRLPHTARFVARGRREGTIPLLRAQLYDPPGRVTVIYTLMVGRLSRPRSPQRGTHACGACGDVPKGAFSAVGRARLPRTA